MRRDEDAHHCHRSCCDHKKGVRAMKVGRAAAASEDFLLGVCRLALVCVGGSWLEQNIT